MAYALLGLLTLLLLLAGGGLLYLDSTAGGTRVRREVLATLNGALQGSVELRGLQLNGDEIVLRNLKLYDPERRLVAEIAEVHLHFSVSGLLSRHLTIREANVLQPRLYLISEERGLNLTRALAARRAALEREAPETKKPSRLSFLLQRLTIEGGTVDFVHQGEAKDLKITLDGLSGEGNGEWSGPESSFSATLDLRGLEHAPLEGPASLTVQAALRRERLEASVGLQAPGLALDASASRSSQQEVHVDLTTARLEPGLARALADHYPLRVPAQLSGTADLHGDTVSAKLEGEVGRARASLRGAFDVKKFWSEGLTLSARDVDLSELTPDGPRTNLNLEASARGGGRTLGSLVGEVKLTVPPSEVRDERLGPIQLSASADHGRFHLLLLRAELPGLSVDASGDGSMERVSLRGTLRAGDLSQLSRSLGRLRRSQLPALEGRGALEVAVEGPLRHPGLTLDGQFPLLRFQDQSVSGLELHARIPDVTLPLSAEASAQAAQVKAGGRDLRRVSVEIAGEGRETLVDASFTPVLPDGDGVWRESSELTAHVAGLRDEDSRGLLVRELTLHAPEATWTLQAPARVAFRDGASAEPLHLVSGTQSVTVGGEVRRGAMDAALEVQRLDLKLLPGAFVDPKLDLAGLLSAKVRARGPVKDLEVNAEVELDGGRVRRWDALGLTLSGHYAHDRAAGSLRLTSRLARLSARFDLPVQGLARRRHEPIEAVIELDPQPIGASLVAAGRRERVTGTAGASLTVVGTADDPSARLSIRARNLRVPDHPGLLLQEPSLDVTVEADHGGALSARVEVEATGTAGEPAVRTPFTLAGLLEHPPDEAALRAASYSVEAAVRDFPLEWLEAAGVQDLRGRASLRAELRGTLEDPALNAHLEGRGVALGKAPPSDMSMDLVADERGVTAGLRAHRGPQSLADVTARVGAPIHALLQSSDFERTPLAIDGTVGPISLEEWLPAPQPGRDPEDHGFRPPTGQVAGRLRGRGTLADPELELLADVEQLRSGDACVGRGTIHYRYARALSTLQAALTTTGQGRATVEGTLKLDLSAPALRRGVDVSKAPLEASLSAKDFELAVLSGSLPQVRRIGGKLSADARLSGTLEQFGPKGWVEWRDGALALDGYGEYHGVQLRAEAASERVTVSKLEAQSGAGHLSATADAARSGDHFHLTGQVSAEKFPVVYEDQPYAAVTSRFTVQGDLSRHLVDLQQVDVPEAHVELPDVKRKDLQELARPGDIVLVRRGRPLDRKRRAPAAPGSGGLRYAFNIHAPRNVWIEKPDANLEVGLSDRFRFEYDERARLFGEVHVLRGRASALGREFEVQRDSRVTFTGPPARPHVNVTGVYVNTREDVTVFMTVEGEGKDLAFKPSSQPPLSESEIYVLLATGRRTLKAGSGMSLSGGDAASVLGSLLTSQLKGSITQLVPLDVVSVESGGGGGLSGTKVELGTYLSDKAFVGGEVRLGADQRKGENTYGFRFEYQITPRLSLQAEYGDANAGGADLIWSREY